MKKLWIAVVGITLLLFSGIAHATLWDRGGDLIYDDVLDITWLQDANYACTSGYDDDGKMTWDDALVWADQLVYGGYNDWRLPATVDGPYPYSDGYDGTTTAGFNINSGEMGYMYYENLDNLSVFASDGTWQSGGGLTNTGPFLNLQSSLYWTGTDYTYWYQSAWYFAFNGGKKYDGSYIASLYAWAVRDGDVGAPVPEPTTILLLGSGLIGLAGFRRKKFKK